MIVRQLVSGWTPPRRKAIWNEHIRGFKPDLLMTFKEALDRSQSKGRALIKAKIDERRASGEYVHVEPPLCDSAGQVLSAPDGLKLPLRIDLAYQSPQGSATTENVDSHSLYFREPVFADWENRLRVEIRSLTWDAVQFRFSPVPSGENWEGIRQWFLKWFDMDDEKIPAADGLCGVVHFVSDPKKIGDTIKFDVDFGSAAIEAFGEFLDEIVKLNATYCVVGEQSDAKNFIVKNPDV
jgi:hypothetical protein